GISTSTIKYFSFGETRSTTGALPTDKKFTGQRLDNTGLYYYNARYYDATIGRFISPDPITHSEPLPRGKIITDLTVCTTHISSYTGQTRCPTMINPQEHNRYSYALNNPLKLTDPDGHQEWAAVLYFIYYFINLYYTMVSALTGISFIPAYNIGHNIEESIPGRACQRHAPTHGVLPNPGPDIYISA
ncbi:MAG: RHS repeat-associated core domain-containing protein, partial [Dehalococcoidales bacterium]|nr:RHS repeat-associated core domain-containing protein [Dehalococcoidales bacterium]